MSLTFLMLMVTVFFLLALKSSCFQIKIMILHFVRGKILVLCLVLRDVEPDVVGDAHVGGVSVLAADEDGVGGGLGERQAERHGRLAELLRQAGLHRRGKRS